jgi:hypothetical protein
VIGSGELLRGGEARWERNGWRRGASQACNCGERELTVMRAVFWDEKGGCWEAGVSGERGQS